VRHNDLYWCNLCNFYLGFEGARVGYGLILHTDFPTPRRLELVDLPKSNVHICTICIEEISKLAIPKQLNIELPEPPEGQYGFLNTQIE